MSKLVTQRFEYVLIDDAAGNLNPPKGTPPTYPRAVDSYSTSSTASAAQSYGAYTLTGNGVAVPLVTPPGATIVVIGDSKNTSLVLLSQPAVSLTPGSAAGPLGWPVGPGQTVTFPGCLNAGTISVQGCSTSYAVNNTPFTVTIMWSI